MTIGDRIFDKLDELNMSQKEFAELTGIAQSTVCDWRKKHTNPAAEKILIICKVLNVSPQWLLSGVEATGDRKRADDLIVIDPMTESGTLMSAYNSMGKTDRARLLGYAEALTKK